MNPTSSSAIPRRRSLKINTGNNNNREESRSDDDEGEDHAPLSPASRLFHQPSFNCHILAVMGIGRPIDIDVVAAGLDATLARHPRFSSLQVFDKAGKKKPKWVKTTVVVRDHLVVPHFDLDFDSESTTTVAAADQLVEDYISSLSTTTLDRSRPLWDIHILNIPTSRSEAVAIIRAHHSLGDGTSLMSLLLACTRKTSDPDSLPTLPGKGRSLPAGQRRIGLLMLLISAWSIIKRISCALLDVLLFLATIAFLSDTDTPLKGPEGVEFHRKRFVHRTVSLDDVKAIKGAMDCTINDVLIGVTSAALSRYLGRSYADANVGTATEKNKCLNLANIRLRTTLLINIRPTPGIHALAEMMKGEKGGARWGNYMGYIILPFSIMECDDPLNYVRKGKAVAERKKSSLEAVFSYTSAYWIVKLFGIKVASSLSHRVLRHTTLSFSNIVGPVEEIGFYGHPLVYLAPSVYGHPQALTIHFQSYMNGLTIVLAVDELVVPHPDQLLDDLAESLQLIKDAAVAKS